MNVTEILSIDIDVTRFILVAAIAVAMIVYTRWHLAVGGTLTGGYLVLLVLGGQWPVIFAIILTALISRYLVLIVFTRFAPVTKNWLFLGSVTLSAIVMTALVQGLNLMGPIDMPWGISLVLTTGAYITPGIMAYDLAHQGWAPTLTGLGLVMAGSLAIVVPVLIIANILQPESVGTFVETEGNIPPALFGWASIAVVLFTAAVRLSFDLRTGGFIGALFLFEFFTPEAFITVGISAIVTYAIIGRLQRLIPWTPRQRFQATLAVGAMVAWTGLYWASLAGWLPAQQANAYALAPLLAVGLLAADMGRERSGIVRTLAGASLGAFFIALVVWSAEAGTVLGWVLSVGLVLAVPGLLIIPGARAMHRARLHAVAVGREVADHDGALWKRDTTGGRS